MSDEEKAFAVANELTAEVPPEPEKSLVRAGTKKKIYARTNRPPFPGLSVEDSDILRHIIGLKFTGHTMAEAFDLSGLNHSNGHQWLAARQDAYAMAEQELMEIALNGYQTNLWIMRTALSELGPRAVKTLGEIMDNKRESGNTRLKAAQSILKMVDVDHSATGGAQEGLAKELVEAIKSATNGGEKKNIIDAEDVEIVENGNDGDCAAVQ